MPYLTFEEFTSLIVNDDITPSEFDKLLVRASDFLDIETRNFYRFNDLESDIPFRRDKFKKAIAYQIEYMHVTEALTSYDINTPTSWSIGRTSVTEASRYSNSGKNEVPSIVSEDAISMLSGTGLLFRGVST